MNITILTEVLPPFFHWDPTAPVRGTEKFYVKTARCLSKKHKVTVVYDGPLVTYGDNLRFVDRNNMPIASDAVLVCNRQGKLDGLYTVTDRLVEWTNFANWKDYGSVGEPLIVISQTAKKLVQNKTNRPIHIVGHGVAKEVYFNVNQERDKTVVYTSSPDRGLNRLLRLWRDHQIEKVYGYRLVVSAYGDAAVSDKTIADTLRKASFWVHPGEGIELFCLAAVEAQACGATPIVVPNGALSETVMHGYRFPDKDFDDGLLAVLSGDARMPHVTADHIPDWQTVTDEIERLLIG